MYWRGRISVSLNYDDEKDNYFEYIGFIYTGLGADILTWNNIIIFTLLFCWFFRIILNQDVCYIIKKNFIKWMGLFFLQIIK